MRLLRFLAFPIFFIFFASAAPVSIAQWPTRAAEIAAEPLDLNTATSRQLRALPGFGDAYVRRVIAGRPYTAKNQLVTRGVLPQEVYDQIASRIIAHRRPK